MDRIKKLCSYLDKCVTFADVGCDHGYCTSYMLKNNLCSTAQISDISEKCLKKAETLLKDYCQSGRVVSVCCSGLEKIDSNTDQVLIAGMGGEEIVAILKNAFIPKSFVLQPMKNARTVREFLLKSGAGITCDEVFLSGGKFYFVIKGNCDGNGQAYCDLQLDYGLNLHSKDMQKYLLSELTKKRGYLDRPLSESSREEILLQIKKIEGILDSETLRNI